MASLCFYFQIHQPYRLKRYRVFDIGEDHNYFNDQTDSNLNNEKVFRKVAEKCYLPANAILLDLLKQYPEFKISFSLSGVFIEQMEAYGHDVLDSFKKLINTGRAEILAETYYHSLASIFSKTEFTKQIKLHSGKIKQVFGLTPTVFRNTELIYNNDIAKLAESLGFKAILAEGADHVLDWRSPNLIYSPKGARKIKLLLKNYRLSDDIAFRFSSRDWSEFPLTADKYVQWLGVAGLNGSLINLFMDYETFGEHQWEETGIFDFLRALPAEWLKSPSNNFVTPGEAAKQKAEAELDVPHFVSWADVERDLSAWLSNEMQQNSAEKLFALEKDVLKKKDAGLLADWRRLQTSDHFYYMCTKWWNDGDVHKYFNPHYSPYDAFISFMNALTDLKLRIYAKKSHVGKR